MNTLGRERNVGRDECRNALCDTINRTFYALPMTTLPRSARRNIVCGGIDAISTSRVISCNTQCNKVVHDTRGDQRLDTA